MKDFGRIQILVPTGFGLNCEAESAFAFERLGARVNRLHWNDLFADPRPLDEAHLLYFIGGFSYGDHIASGRVLATRIRHRLAGPLGEFIERGKLMLGVCNGFQVMVKMGLLPAIEGRYFHQQVSLAPNLPAKFRDAWVMLRVDPLSPCVFTRGLKRLALPVRHGEGRFVAESSDLMRRLAERKLFPLHYADPMTGAPTERYPANPNGSPSGVAGLCDPSGRLFGLMPHPEAHLSCLNHPQWPRFHASGLFDPDGEGDGAVIFRNALEFIADHLL